MRQTVAILFRKTIITVLFFALFDLVSAAPESNLSLSEVRNHANEALRLGRLPEAVEYYRIWTEREPRRTEAYIGFGRSLLGLGYFDRAKESFQQASKIQPNSIDSKIGLAEISLAKGEAQIAYDLLSSVRKIDPSNIDLNLAFSNYYRYQNRNDLRRGFIDKALRIDNSSLPAILELAVLSADEGKITDAEKALEKAALISPDGLNLIKKRAEIHYALSFRGYGTSQLEKARHYYRSYIHAAGDDPSALSDLIHVEYLLGHPAEAKKLSDRLVDSNYSQKRPILFANIAEANRTIKDLVDYLQTACDQRVMPLSCFRFEEVLIQNDQNQSLALYRLNRMKSRIEDAKRRRARNRTDLEELHLKRAMELNSEDPNLRRQILERYRKNGSFEDYLKLLLQLRKDEPNEHKWNIRLSEALRLKPKYLPYRIGLDESNYQRHSQNIIVFDLQPNQNLMQHYREPSLVANFIRSTISKDDRFKLAGDSVRNSLIRKLDSLFLFYDPNVPKLLQEMGSKIDAIIEGSYDLRPASLVIRLKIRNRDGIILGSFNDSANTADVDLLSAKILEFIESTLTFHATLIDANQLIINAGRADGVKVGDTFTTNDIKLKVVEVTRYVSRVSLESGRSDALVRNLQLTKSSQ